MSFHEKMKAHCHFCLSEMLKVIWSIFCPPFPDASWLWYFSFFTIFFSSLIFSYIVQFRDIFGIRFVCIYLSSWWFIIHLFFRYQHPYHSIERTELFNRVLYAWWKYCSRFGQQLWNVRAAICSISQTNHFLAMSTDEGEYFASNSIHLVVSNRIISTWPPLNHNIDLFIEYIKLNIRKKK